MIRLEGFRSFKGFIEARSVHIYIYTYIHVSIYISMCIEIYSV